MGLVEIYGPIQSELKAAEQLLIRELGVSDGLLGEMTRYIARMPGKRIRPALALLGAGLIGSRGQTPRGLTPAVKLAVAVEMIHTATLLHDDVIDGASLRRGLSTLNSKWGDTLSVLSGDYLYSKAFCLLSDLRHEKVLRLMSDTARTVCEGEVAQIQHQFDLDLSRRRYLKIIGWKTASLMGAAAQAGALLGGAAGPQAERLGCFGLNFGLAFQILDDTQDLLGVERDLGKSLGTDLGQGQMTLPLIYLRDVAGPKTQKALAHWFHGNGNGQSAHSEPVQAREQVERFKTQAIRFGVPGYCRRVADRYLAKARTALEPFPSSPHKSALLSLTNFLLR